MPGMTVQYGDQGNALSQTLAPGEEASVLIDFTGEDVAGGVVAFGVTASERVTDSRGVRVDIVSRDKPAGVRVTHSIAFTELEASVPQSLTIRVPPGSYCAEVSNPAGAGYTAVHLTASPVIWTN